MGRLQNKLAMVQQTRNVRKVLTDICEILDNLEGIECYVERSSNRWKINVSPSSLPDGTQQYQVPEWTGSAWIAGWVRAVDLT